MGVITREKMNVLMLNHEFPPVGGGAAPVTLELCKHLVQEGHAVDVVTMHYGNLPKFEEIEGVRTYRTPAIRKSPNICYTHEMATYLPGAICKALRLAKENRYDIIHCHFIIPGGPLALLVNKLTKIPYIVTAHGSDVPGFNPDRFQWQHKFTKPILKAVCKNAAMLTSPSQYLRNLILNNIGHYDIRHVPNGIDLDNFKLDLAKPKEDIILATGRLLKRKGFQTLIKAVRDIELPFEVHIAGEGPCRAELEELAKSSKTKVVFHGWIEQGSRKLMNLYERACIYVLPSSHENASVALLEAMAAKCVMITTNVSGCPETVGDCGFLIDFEDYDKLREILITLSKEKELISEYSEKSYARLLDNFLWDKIVADYVEIYRQTSRT